MATFNSRYYGKDDAPSEPSAWEEFLSSLGILESNCAALMAAKTQEGQTVRSWVWQNYATRYVPEYILDLLGLRERLTVRWPGTETENVSFIELEDGN